MCFLLILLDKLDGVLRCKRHHSEIEEEEEGLTLSDYIKRKREEYNGNGKSAKKRVLNNKLFCACVTVLLATPGRCVGLTSKL